MIGYIPSGCTLPYDYGIGGEHFIQYFYDAYTGSCRTFDYSGAGGNNNRFNDIEECMARCGTGEHVYYRKCAT